MARKQVGTAAANATDAATLGDLSKVASVYKTAAYTLVLSDGGKVVEINSNTAVNVTVPLYGNAAYPLGTIIEVMQYGTGQLTLVGDTGVTLRTPSSLSTRAQYSSLSLRLRTANEWIVGGDMT